MNETITVYETVGPFVTREHVVTIVSPPVHRVWRASALPWQLLGVDPRHPGRVLIRGAVSGKRDVLSIPEATWLDPRGWRDHAASSMPGGSERPSSAFTRAEGER